MGENSKILIVFHVIEEYLLEIIIQCCKNCRKETFKMQVKKGEILLHVQFLGKLLD